MGEEKKRSGRPSIGKTRPITLSEDLWAYVDQNLEHVKHSTGVVPSISAVVRMLLGRIKKIDEEQKDA